jgi:hypothetical protein
VRLKGVRLDGVRLMRVASTACVVRVPLRQLGHASASAPT